MPWPMSLAELERNSQVTYPSAFISGTRKHSLKKLYARNQVSGWVQKSRPRNPEPWPSGYVCFIRYWEKSSSPYSLFPYTSVGKLKLDGGGKIKPCKSSLRLEGKKKKKTNRFAFILRRQWVAKWIPTKTRAGLSHRAGNAKLLWFCRPCRAWPDGWARECGLQPERTREKIWKRVSDFLLGYSFGWGPRCKPAGWDSLILSSLTSCLAFWNALTSAQHPTRSPCLPRCPACSCRTREASHVRGKVTIPLSLR